VVVYNCSKSIIDSVPQLGNFLSLSDVTLNNIADSGFRDAVTGALATQRMDLAVYEPLEQV
jgi:hypothetical protein